ncbi:diguanylate cyclase [Frankia sp. AgB32]|uniref:diguanylate cyclase domain-containing protein n=1 Tax=Frankia sp. AgB32 TaxID=631119 RepID=UPI00200D8894|nr:diguanylate cyclase [Frankia sp. AgB32]MCK9894471.1 diguanylate cyclase [Frankia sp. AgB32]
MGLQGRAADPDPAVVLRTERVHESARSRVTRLVLSTHTVIRKEALAAGGPQRSRHEAEILDRLTGVEGVAQPAAGPDQDDNAILLADVGGPALSERTTPLAQATLITTTESLARTVAEIHQRGVVHRDISPANIVMRGDHGRPHLIDFALATTLVSVQPGFVHPSEVAGTLAYLAPEQTGRTARPVDQRADLYALGATLYELATGTPPFGTGEPLRIIHDHLARVPVAPTKLNPAVPASLSAIIMHLLEKEPDDRYQSADGLLRDLAVLRRGETLARPGTHDVPARTMAPSRLAGRDEEIGELRTAFLDALAGRCTGLLVSGAPGVGKTALVNELRPIVAGADGWFVAGKFDQYRRDLDYDGVRQAFRALIRPLLAEPDSDLAEARERLLASLGPNAGLVSALVPELQALLKVTPEPGDPMTAPGRIQRGAVEMLRAVASQKRPVVFFVDDLQWADRTPLGTVEQILGGEERIDGLLLVAAYREDDVDATHPLAPMLARWRSQPLGPRHLRLGGLAAEGQSGLVADLLHLDPRPAAELARLIAPATHGNPYDTVELVNTLRHDRLLAADERGWGWDPAELRARLDSVDMTALLATRLAALPPATTEVLSVLACLAGRVEADLLAAATGLTPGEVERRLAPAFAEGLLVLEPESHQSVRFHHDRTHEALLGALTAEQRRVLRLDLARRLARRPAYFAAAAEQYLHVTDAVLAPAERRVVAGLFRRAADESVVVANHALAERFLSAAVRLADRADPAQLIELYLRRHVALTNLGRLEEADGVFHDISRLGPPARQYTAAVTVQITSLNNRGLVDEAMRIGLDHLASLGLAIPAPADLGAEVDRALDELYRWSEETGAADDLARASDYDAVQTDITRVISSLSRAAYFGDLETMAWLSVRSMQLWAQRGPAPDLLVPAGLIPIVTETRRNDYHTGYRIMRRVLEVGRARGYTADTWRLEFLYTVGAGHRFGSLEDNVAAARRTLEGLIQTGDLQLACWTHYPLIQNLLDCAPSLDLVAAEVEDALTFSARTGNTHAADTFRAYRHLVRILRGECTETAADQATTLSLVADDPQATLSLHVTRAFEAAVLAQPEDLARHTEAVFPAPPTVETSYAMSVTRVLRALSLAGRARRVVDRAQHDALLTTLDELVSRVSELAADAPANFRHLLRLMEAERAWTVGDFRQAAYLFDAAQSESLALRRPWHRALILEHAARFYLAHGLRDVGGRLLAAARREYLAWGAHAKVNQLDWAYPALNDVASAAAPAASQTLAAGSIDLLGIVAASQALSSETSIDGLRARVVGILSEMTGATAVHLVLRDEEDDGWSVPSGSGEVISLGEASRRRLLPSSVVRYCERTQAAVVAADATGDDRFHRDPYFTDLDRCSVLAVPIVIRGAARAVLLLENRMIRDAFSVERLDGILMIAKQLAVSLDNAQLYASLENKVADRTHQLATANHRLELLSLTDPLTGLANRRHLEDFLSTAWQRAQRQGTPIALVMIDIDFFKRYNDHLGHAAGDRCLEKVAACLAENTGAGHLAARYGGEEFAVVMPGTDAEDARCRAERLRRAVADLAEPHPAVRTRIVTISVGFTSLTPTAEDHQQRLVDLADEALYRAKRHGRDQVEAATPKDDPGGATGNGLAP